MPLSVEFFDVDSKGDQKALNRLTLKLVRCVILKSTKAKKRWLARWEKSELLTDGYSERIIAKAREYDLREQLKINIFLAIVYILPNFMLHPWGLLVALFWFLIIAFTFHQYRKSKLSFADNLLVLEELKQKLGADILERTEIPEEHPLLETWNRRNGKRPLLWRLDAFLSRKPTNP
jgi:hypothetical protein